MESRATHRFLRMSSSKVRVLARLLVGKNVTDAMGLLRYTTRGAVAPLEKLLRSAMANAEQKPEIDAESLYVKSIVVNEGPTLRRYQPRAMGRATRIRKRTSHVEIVLDER